MKVSDLIIELQKQDQDKEIMCPVMFDGYLSDIEIFYRPDLDAVIMEGIEK
jgi:hypothetical protein